MYHTTRFPGLKDVIVTKTECRGDEFHLHVEEERKAHCCPECGTWTRRVHDYRTQKLTHLKMWERRTVLFYRRRRYACPCGKRFAEKTTMVERYQRHTVEWNQALGLRTIQGKNFTDTAKQFHTSPTTAMRRFDDISRGMLRTIEHLPPVIAIDEYKGDTNRGKYQVILADGVTGEPLDILPDRRSQTIKRYLQRKGAKVEVVVMDMSPSFKTAVNQALGSPVIVADRFHFCRYTHWSLDRIRREVQHTFHDYDRKKCKQMRHVFHKPADELSQEQRWHLERYLNLSEKLRKAHELKEHYQAWFQDAKTYGKTNMKRVKEGLYRFYEAVEASEMPAFQQAAKTLRNWQTEILNSFLFGYTNGPVEGLNNQTKVIKRNAFGFRRYDRLRLKVLLHHQCKQTHFQVG
ncbi:Transposase [Salisediminibacterium halotolerans]|uniref:Transposase n=2 Tax=Salisediminibacterium halotolerans TaxID=517425 RepID=A0A1H9WZ60_9BACI|nr:ISL3 family transposase [Salisediminibacterium haloalkalitolerans]SES39212.1 Transposase [Salisediminibacterium haloalkalitolerans]